MFALISRRKRIRASSLGVTRSQKPPRTLAVATETETETATDLHRQQDTPKAANPFAFASDFCTKSAPNPPEQAADELCRAIARERGERVVYASKTGLTAITPDDPQKSIYPSVPNYS